MTLTELKEKLIAVGVKKSAYSLTGGLPSEEYCISQTPLGWEVYYSERGSKSGLKTFNSEEEACDYFYADIIRDKTVF